ncbi:S8 family serine peptidase [Geodermatophilus amargosae]|nr:S8 family serine peptidase [Geodermatophilus amargosae]
MAAARASGITSAEPEQEWRNGVPAAAIVEARDAAGVADRVKGDGEVLRLSQNFLSVRADVETLARLTEVAEVRRVQTKKLSQPHLDAALPDIGLVAPQTGQRPFAEDGEGVLVGIVDSGFDLSHPMFRDANGQLRVEGLLDQSLAQPREFSTGQLEQGWASGRGPGADENGHGTHVAAIAAGSRFGALEGVAPGARLLLVKTNFRDTDTAVSWVFRKAGARPCVVNLSLGHHFGAHDGTDAEERLHGQLTGPGKIIVVSAGNERGDDIHIGGRFHPGQAEQVPFDLQRQSDGTAFAVLTLWHARADRFAISLVTPAGEVIDEPPSGSAIRRTFAAVAIDLAQQRYRPSDLIEHQIALDVRAQAGNGELRGWRVRINCRAATIGRLDGWFNNSGFAAFRAHAMSESARTVGLSATGDGCLAVASHVTRNAWDSDSGPMQDARLVPGRTSAFSSLGPSRDGRQKPDVSAPGQMVTAALAQGSESAADDRFASNGDQLLTIAGTSMAAPVVTGAVAMLLQQKPDRNLGDVRDLLRASVRRDVHTGPGPWDPAYGLGKLDVAAALRAT